MGLNDFTGGPPPDNTGNNGGVPGFPGIGGSSGGGSQYGSSGIDPMDTLINYNTKFQQAGQTLFRETITQQLAGVLIGKNKPNACLVGPAGCGKTRIVEDLAYRLANQDPTLPDKLQGYVIYELPLGSLISGTKYRGELEEKLKIVIDFLSDPKNRAIVFIDEIHQLADERMATHQEIAQILKPALARADIRCIGATTTQEANMLMDDPALNRRFSRIIVDEFTQEQTIKILDSARAGFSKHYGYKVLIDDAILPTIVRLADEYRPAGSHRPDNALTLLDRACGDTLVDYKVKLDAAKNNPPMLQALQSITNLSLTEAQVKRTAIRLMTGSAAKFEFDIDAMKAALSVIRGQDDVLDKILTYLKRRDRNLFPTKRPLTLLFAGSSGVGKTETVKIIAKQLTGVNPIILNMTEYHSPASINRIIGAPAGYVGSDSKAELPFDGLESNPYQVILLDEFEKSDPSVQKLFMGAFDEGFIKTNRGKIVDFSRSIIIATTNAGRTNVAKRVGFGEANEPKNAPKASVSSLLKYFKDELLNRFTDIMTFNSITSEMYRTILTEIYDRELKRILAERPRIKLPAIIPDADLDEMVKTTYVPEFGARPAYKTIQGYIEDNAV